MSSSEGRIANIEGQRNLPKPEFLEKLLRIYGREEETEQYLALLGEAKGDRAGWEHIDLTADPIGYEDYLGLERGASKIEGYESRLVPGLLQTYDYARHVIRGRQRSDSNMEQKIELRTRRQDILTRADHPVRAWMIIEEQALDRPVGSSEVMVDQLGHLLELGDLDNVQLQVCPTSLGPHPALTAPFTIIHVPIPDDPGLVCFETRVKTIWFDKQAEVDQHTEIMDHLRTLALTPEQSRTLLDGKRKELR
ncbi:transcriptional regulator with XRE-family HTH domain [Actinopolyspora biskrensis]|uniref:Transcriptional regulator with XRE-family HTH domain n=2 Tax=Actinopolyspora biskrensis TaxID=1470178 RepID=A0A852Z202_9ACTN|nr:transcriptional regulator with XRE-family HTH domain [Actinopolyspora biskrensis]